MKLFTEDAGTIGKNAFELEFGYSFGHASEGFDKRRRTSDRGTTNAHTLTVSLTYGLADKLDLGLDLGYAWNHDEDIDPDRGDDLTDTGVGLKYNFYQNEKLGLLMSYAGSLTIPTGSTTIERKRLGTSQEFW